MKPLPVGTKVRLRYVEGRVASWCPQYYGKIGIQFADGTGVILDRTAITVTSEITPSKSLKIKVLRKSR